MHNTNLFGVVHANSIQTQYIRFLQLTFFFKIKSTDQVLLLKLVLLLLPL